MASPNAERTAPGVSGNGSQGNDHAGERDNLRDSNNPQNIKPKCKRCGRVFKRERVEQKYCNARCRNAAVKARLRARSGDKKPSKRHLVLPQREAVTNGQKKPVKTKAFFDPLTVNFRHPVVDLLQRGGELRRHVVAVECAKYPPRYRRPPPNGDDIVIEMDADGFPVMPAFLRREVPRSHLTSLASTTPNRTSAFARPIAVKLRGLAGWHHQTRRVSIAAISNPSPA